MWVFGYGSLMWDGWENQFGCLRRPVAVLHGYQRTFNKASTENWGTREVPCPNLSLVSVEGGVCKGIAFEFSDSREASVRGYLAGHEGKGLPLEMLTVRLQDDAEVQAWAPVYNGKNLLSGDVAQKAAMISRAAGTKSACKSYIKNIAKMLDTLGIDDPAVSELWKELNRLVKVQYIAIYKLHSVNKLPEAAEDASLFKQQHPALSAKLNAFAL
jgi:cation transport protein ChaC